MNRQLVNQQETPPGCERYGSTSGTEASGIASVYAMPGTEPASPSGVPWGVHDGCEYHYPEGHGCRAPKVRGDNFCIGHKRARLKLEKIESENSAEEPDEETQDQGLEAEVQE